MIDISIAWLMVKNWARANHFLVAALICWAAAILSSVAIVYFG